MSSLRSGIKQVKVARPRPLKIGGGTQPELGVEDLVSLVDNVRRILTSSDAGAGGFDIVGQLKVLSANLRLSGSSLETNNKDLIEKFAQALLGACKDEKWPLVARVHMLELIEMRSMEWRPSDTMNSYYKQKLAQIETQQKSQTAPALTNSESDNNPFQASFNNNYQQCPELSNPVKPETEPAKVSLSLKVRGEELVVTGVNMELVKTAKIVLNEFFNVVTLGSSGVVSVQNVQNDFSKSGTETEESDESNIHEDVEEEEDDTGIELVEPQISYNKDELLAMSKSPFCQELPETWSHIAKELPGVLRRPEPRLVGPTSKLIMREMEGLKRQEEAKPSIM